MPRQTRLAIHVAAGVLRNSRGEVLIAERTDAGPFFGLWEFPGGKIQAGETPQTALCRELEEELGIAVLASTHFMNLSHAYIDRQVDLEFFLVSDWQGEPVGIEGQRIRWVEMDKLDAAEMLPADAPLIAALRDAD